MKVFWLAILFVLAPLVSSMFCSFEYLFYNVDICFEHVICVGQVQSAASPTVVGAVDGSGDKNDVKDSSNGTPESSPIVLECIHSATDNAGIAANAQDLKGLLFL